MSDVIVPGEGPTPARWAIVGERPGEEEGHRGRPFVGKTGQEQDRHLERGGLHRRDGYLTNLCKDYIPGNPSPTPEDVERWGPQLLKELRRVKPRFIISAGHHSTRFFLGESAYLEAVHGIPHAWSDGNGHSAVVIPTYHPAAHFYQPDLLQYIVWDYGRACAAIKGKLKVSPASDEYPNPRYMDLASPEELFALMYGCPVIATDTEGVPGSEWSFQVCGTFGVAGVARKSRPFFKSALRQFVRQLRGKVLVGHNLMYEFQMFYALGLDILDPDLEIEFFDTQMAAYLLCIEPQSLKMLARRHCGMVMHEYMEVVGKAGLDKQLAYLEKVFESKWPEPEERIERENDGTSRIYRPQPVGRRAESILTDYYSGKLDKEGKPTDPLKRWRKVDRDLRRTVERRIGKMPIGTLADIPLREAVHYSGRDPDATLRLYPKMKAALEAEGLTDLMNLKMRMLPVVAQMRINGILGEREAFETLRDRMWDEMDVLSGKISRQFMGGKPFNPASQPQTETLMRRQGLVGEKKTKKGRMSTSKKSIEHLRFDNPAIDMLENWRERQKIKDSFCESVLDNWPDDPSALQVRVHCDIKTTRVSSGRFSASLLDDEPSAPLLAIPVRSTLGKAVRDCYRAEEGYELLSADLDQAEMRLMADESNDARLVKLFNEGKLDIHTDTASKMFGVPYDKVDKMKHRYPAKRVGFGVITGIQGKGLLDQLRMVGILNYDVDDCDRFIRDWLKIYPGVAKYMQWCRDECRRNGGVIKDRWGMPRYLPAILDERREAKYDRLEAERQTHSHRIQGGAQGYLQNVMAWLRRPLARYGDLTRFILQIHDELIFEVAADPEIKQEVYDIVIDGMVNHGGTKLRVPVKSSGSYALRWGGLKD